MEVMYNKSHFILFLNKMNETYIFKNKLIFSTYKKKPFHICHFINFIIFIFIFIFGLCESCYTRVELCIINHYIISYHFIKSSSFVLHFERFKMLCLHHLRFILSDLKCYVFIICASF